MLKLYTSNFCNKCKMLKTWLGNQGIPYEEVNTSDEESMIDKLVEEGFTSLPILEVNGKKETFTNVSRVIELVGGKNNELGKN